MFANNHIPAHTDIPAAYVESTFVGYAPITPPAFGVPYLNGFGKGETDSGPLVWTFTAGVGTATVYGMYLTDVTGLKVLMAVKFLAPIVLTPGSPTLSQLLQVTAISEL